MNIDRVFAVVGSALDSQRQRLNIIAGNLANAESTRSPNGGPYIRRDVVFQATSTQTPFHSVFTVPLVIRQNLRGFGLLILLRIHDLYARCTTLIIRMPMTKGIYICQTSILLRKW